MEYSYLLTSLLNSGESLVCVLFTVLCKSFPSRIFLDSIKIAPINEETRSVIFNRQQLIRFLFGSVGHFANGFFKAH